MLTSEKSPLSEIEIKNWIKNLDEKLMVKQGWTAEALEEAFDKYEYAYLKADKSASAVILYQQLDQDLLEVLFLGTRADLLRQGLMFILLTEFSEQYGEDYRLWLECREDNRAAQNLYRKVGFKEAGRRPNYYKDGTSAILFNI